MERHHKVAVLPSSAGNPAVFNRNPILVRVAEVKRCNWWPAKLFSVIHLAVIALFLICFIIQLWCLWRLPHDQDAYPDGFGPCPSSYHKILDDNNVTVMCTPCPKCPSGQQLAPPCGSTTQSETSIECRACPSGSYKEGHGISKCKPCLTCGLRKTISHCTSENNTQCGECPRGYYQEDYTMNSCRKCSTCCGIKRFAELECIYLNQCKRTNCTQQMENEKSHVPTLEKVFKMFPTLGRITHLKRITHRSISQSNNSESVRNWVLEDIVSQLKKTKFKREANMTIQRTDSDKYVTKVVEEITTPKDDNSSPLTTAIVDGDKASLITIQSKSQEDLGTVPDYSSPKPTLPLTSSYFSNFKTLVTILIALVGIAIMVLILNVVLVAWKKRPEKLPGSSCTITCCAKHIYLRDGEEYLLHDTSQTDSQDTSYIGDVVGTSEEDPDTGNFESFALSEIPPNLESILRIKMDVYHNGEFGWKKLGNAFGIDTDILKYLQLAYKHDHGSPTQDLLEILKSHDRTVADLINKLKSPKVNRPDVALLVCQHITTMRN